MTLEDEGRAQGELLETSEAKREPDYERLQALIRDDILSGALAGGARLKVNELASTYGTSTNPVREALRGLEGEGLVTVLPNRGASVRMIDAKFIANIYDLRGMIEPFIVRYFTEVASPSELDALEFYADGCDRGIQERNYKLFQDNNVAFHATIIDGFHNEEAIAIMRKHSVWFRALNRKRPLNTQQMQRSNAEHREFIEAVHRGDADVAVAVMRRHRQNARRIFLDRMGDFAGSPDQAAPSRVAAGR